MVARLGGDEFAILLPGADWETAIPVAERIEFEVRKPIEIDGHRLEVGASIGIALYPEHGQGARELFLRADEDMYASKRRRDEKPAFSADSVFPGADLLVSASPRWVTQRARPLTTAIERQLELVHSGQSGALAGGTPEGRDGQAQPQSGQPGSRVEEAEQGVELVGSQESQVGRDHDLAEPRHVQDGTDAHVEQHAAEDRPPPGWPEPEPEGQGEFDQEGAVGHAR